MGDFKNIIVGLDVSKNSVEILKRAFSLSTQNNSELTIVHGIDTNWFSEIFIKSNLEELKEHAITKIEKELKNIETNGIKYNIVVDKETASSLVVDTAKEIDASLIVIGVNSKENFETKVFGSTGHKIAQNSKKPIVIVKNNCKAQYENIVAFSDFSEVSLAAINFSKKFFHKNDIKMVSVYKQASEVILRYYDEYDNKQEVQAEIREKKQEEFKKFIEENNIDNAELIEEFYSISDALLNYVEDDKNDLVVLGSRGVNNSNSFLYGSTTSYLMEHLKKDILVYVP